MLQVPIRYINNGEPLDQVTLNRYMYDTQENLEALFAGVAGAGGDGGSVPEVPDTLVLRDEHGTSQFTQPRLGTNPLRLEDVTDKTNSNHSDMVLSASVAPLLMPSGGIIMWQGTSAPTGWVLCDGSNGTPDLRDRFVVGTGTTYAIGDTGGEEKVTLSIDEMPEHTHAGNTSNAGAHSHSYRAGRWGKPNGTADGQGFNLENLSTSESGSHTHELTIDNTGGSKAHENRPPYYALAYIMKT